MILASRIQQTGWIWLFLLGTLALTAGSLLAVSYCPNQGVEFVTQTITDSTDTNGNPATQNCPGIQIGIDIPGLGQAKIVVLSGGTCPLSQTKVDPHNKVVSKDGFQVSANGTYDVRTREVECNTSANLIVFGTGFCDYGPWVKENSYPDYAERPCGSPDLSVSASSVSEQAYNFASSGYVE